ncbi:fimbrial-like protein [Scandinavium manionii]|uniref:fimbrial-like protein n=1 Tax=Scandinavium manionii TaxID=2926520 RepID=UPI0021659FFF|nr:fimbrial-like protein [Scandinavium manionii]MCS2150252.1 fimbrial-like protein [Scandinavium manionii]MCS2166462.1 fimbrial-like protein [Scandinavium manionii]
MRIYQRCKFITGGLILLVGISQICTADVDVDIQANIINNTCQVTVENNGNIHLPIVTLSYFNTPSAGLSPTDDTGGKSFKIRVTDCNHADADNLHFRFSPRSGIFPPGSRQVFINETQPAQGGAGNVGVVIFSDATHINVLNADGTSDVVYDVSAQSSSQYLTDYLFYARYQNTGTASAGLVTSNVLVDVTYD